MQKYVVPPADRADTWQMVMIESDLGRVEQDQLAALLADLEAADRRRYAEHLFTGYLPAAGDLVERLEDGIRVAELPGGASVAAELLAMAFHRSSVERLHPSGTHDLVCGFDALARTEEPALILAAAKAGLGDGGTLLLVDGRASSNHDENLSDPVSSLLLTAAAIRGRRLWGEQAVCGFLRDAGFTDIEVHDVPADPSSLVYVCRP